VANTENRNDPTPAPPAAETGALQDILAGLNAACADIRLSLVVSSDGLTMATLGHVDDADRAGAMCAALLNLCRSTTLDLQRGAAEQVLVTGDGGAMLLTAAGPQAMLAALARTDTNLGLLLLEARRAATMVAEAL
jgi:uncharacterized protein